MEEKRNAYRILVGKPEGKRPLGRRRRRWVDNIRMDFRGLEVTFPPHDPSDAGSNPKEVVEFLRTEKFREQVLREGL
jgi:hypothetical protein